MPLLVEKHRARVAICYKNFAANKGISHIGLGVSAMQNCRALKAAGILAEVWPITSVQDILNNLAEDSVMLQNHRHVPVSHVVVSAPWLETPDLTNLITRHQQVEFAVVSHSNIGFLQADPGAIRRLREGGMLERSHTNFHIGGNSHNLVTWWEATYGTPMLHLPNMYPTDCAASPKRWSGGTLRIGCFCAIRPYKNILTAAAAALEIGVRLRVTNLEFYMSGGRVEGGTLTIANSINELFSNSIRAKLVQSNWASWPQFVKTVGSMDLLLQPSYTEGFNMVTADGIVQGVASVVSDAIDWAPARWMARADTASDLANVGVSLLHDPTAATAGLHALRKHNSAGLAAWREFLRVFT